MTLRILLVGDLHLGRRPVRLPPEGTSPTRGTWEGALSARAAWTRTVDVALERDVHAVLLAGDVVEKNEDRFQAFGPLEEGVRRLREAGIEVLGVAGNHDDIALPRLARLIEGFRFLGKGGRFELARVDTPGGSFGVLGWSFPRRRHTQDPLDTLTPELREEVAQFDAGPVLGLLHTQVDAGSGPYAPTRSADLRGVPVAAWFLGHVHLPSLVEGAVDAGTQPLGYLGSVSACDIGEAGARGPWLATIEHDSLVHLEHLALSPVRFEVLDLDVARVDEQLEGIEGEDALRDAAVTVLIEEAAGVAERARAQSLPPEAVALRLRLRGRSAHHRELAEFFAERLEAGDAVGPSAGLTCYLEGLRDETRPALEPERLAEGSGPIAVMARKVLALEREARQDSADEADRALTLRAAHDLLEDLVLAAGER